MKKKTKITIAIIIIVLLLLILALLYFLFGIDRTYTIKFNTDGGTTITDVEIKPSDTFKLPKAPTKEGYKFAGWTNEKGEMVNSDIKLDDDVTLESLWIEESKETNTISFETDNDSTYSDIIIEKGKYLILPVAPEKDGYIFVGWVNEDGNIITKKYVINDNIKLYAKWISKDAKTITINFNTDGGNEIDKIIVENGKIVYFPTTPVKDGYVFAGWVNENGEEVNADTTFSGNITLKATWKELYTCPSDCEVSSDGKTCSKTETTNMTTTSSCPSGTKLIKGYCLDVKNQYHAESIDVSPWWKCNSSSEVMYSQTEHGGAFMWCAKKVNKVTSTGCPSGYTKSGDKCTKKTTTNCTLNIAKEYKISN